MTPTRKISMEHYYWEYAWICGIPCAGNVRYIVIKQMACEPRVFSLLPLDPGHGLLGLLFVDRIKCAVSVFDQQLYLPRHLKRVLNLN